MPQLFQRYTNTLAPAAIVAVLVALGAVAWGMHAIIFSPYATDVGQPVAQVVPFSHQHHVAGLGIDCRYCHTGVEKSAFAGLPATETCMTCHSQVWHDAPILAPVRESWTTGQPLRWNRVHNLPDYVYFDHSIHVQKGVACVSCHGRVDRMPLMAKSQTLYMRWCLDCHKEPEGRIGPKSEVFVMKEREPDIKTGAALVRAEGIEKTHLQDCSVCHR
jgi:hypothetical protein